MPPEESELLMNGEHGRRLERKAARRKVIRELSEIFVQPETLLDLRVATLDCRTPNECIEADRADDVLDWIEQLRSGTFT